MKKILLILGGVLCLALIIGAMYLAMTIGMSLYLAHSYRAQMQQQSEQLAKLEAGQSGSVTRNGGEAKKPSLFADPEGYDLEDNWLAAGISREIAGMSFAAAHPDKPLPEFKVKATVDPDKPSVHVEISQVNPSTGESLVSDLQPTFVWDPAGYIPLAKQALGETVGAAPEPETDANDILSHLLNLTGSALALEDMRLSSELQMHPNSWQDHEAAALLLTALAMREAAGAFSDSRTILNRATAHLAVAGALRGDHSPSLAGLIAGAGVRTLSGRELDAKAHLDAISGLPNLPDSAKAWIAALRLLATTDWRGIEVTPTSPLLLKIAWFNVLTQDLDQDFANKRLKKVVPPFIDASNGNPDAKKVNPEALAPDWGRIAGITPFTELSVNDPNNGKDRLNLELHELDEVLQAEGSAPLDLTKLGETLSEKEIDTVTTDSSGKTIFHVVGLGTFKAAVCRHLFAGFPAKNLTPDASEDPAQAEILFSKYDKLFQGVPGYDDARLHFGFVSGEEIEKTYDDWGAAKKTWRVWDFPFSFADGMPGDDQVKAFYRRAVPFGTVYQPALRITYIRKIGAQPSPTYETPELAKIMQLPMNDRVPAVLAYNAKYNATLNAKAPQGPTDFEKKLLLLNPDLYLLAVDHVPTDKLLPVAERFFDYNMSPLYAVSGLDEEHLTDSDRLLVDQKLTVFDPLYYFYLGKSLREAGRADEAAAMDRKGLALAPDQDTALSYCFHLMQYDIEHGLKDEALSIGKRSADSSTYRYFEALEGTGNLDDADVLARKIADTMDDTSPEIMLYVGHPDRFPSESAAEKKRIFPDGLKKADLSSFSAKPSKGVIFDAPADDNRVPGELKPSQLQVTDVLVALDGYRIDTAMQYFYVRSLSRNSTMDFILWRDNRYMEVKAYVPNRQFSLTIGQLGH